jgi:hypothetical protein
MAHRECQDLMRDYRLYCLNGPTNRIIEAEWIVAETDDDAIREARQRQRMFKRELWLPDRRIAEFPERRF